MPIIKKILLYKLFKMVLVVYSLLFCLELFIPGFISNNFELNLILIIAILIGFFSIIDKNKYKENIIKFNPTIFISIVIFGFLVSFKSINFGIFEKKLIIIFTLIMVFFTVLFNYFEDKKILFLNKISLKNFSNKYIKIITLALTVFIIFGLINYKKIFKPQIEDSINNQLIIKIYDSEEDKMDAKEFAKKLNNLGFYKVYYGYKSKENISDVFIYFDDKFTNEINILSKELSKYYSNINLRPAKKDDKESVIIIFGK